MTVPHELRFLHNDIGEPLPLITTHLHFKRRERYCVFAQGQHEKTREELVAYTSLETGHTWFRNPAEFKDERRFLPKPPDPTTLAYLVVPTSTATKMAIAAVSKAQGIATSEWLMRAVQQALVGDYIDVSDVAAKGKK
jgi:hypothetical protein